uniref:PTB domain-containing protein n=1 Tax=Gopherus evgoodei TaxID=1825980 RepID=A0A8C4YLD5_9SAUR
MPCAHPPIRARPAVPTLSSHPSGEGPSQHPCHAGPPTSGCMVPSMSPFLRSGAGIGDWGGPGHCALCPQHLLTVHVDSKDIRDVDDCVARLKMMDAQGRVWGQDMILQVRDHELLLSDIETKEELESFPLESVQACAAVLNCCVYNSILAITVREQSQHGSSILLFQCEQLGVSSTANLEKAVKEWKGERESQDVLR